MEAPFILKTSFYLPNEKNQGRNSAHVKYIGTRPGVSLEETKGFEELQEPDAAHHAKYAGERPGSHGLFTKASSEPLVLTEVQKELKAHEGVVWRMILSLKEEDAVKFGFTEKRSWENMLRATVPEAAKKMGVSESNLKWIAAFHEEKGHPHVHLMMWEKNPVRQKGVLSKGEHRDVKNVFMREIYAEERKELNLIKTAERDFIREFARDTVVDAVKIIKGLQASNYGLTGIAPRLHEHDIEKLQKSLYTLSQNLPTTGRMAYAYMPSDIKREVDHISQWLIYRPQFKSSLDKYLSSTESLTRFHTHDSEKIQQARYNAIADIQKRVAQVILKGALETRINFRPTINIKKAEKAQKQLLKATGKPNQNIGYDVSYQAVKALKSMRLSDDEVKNVFQSWSEKADLNITSKDLQEIIEVQKKEPELSGAIDFEKQIAMEKHAVTILKLSGLDIPEIKKRIPSSVGFQLIENQLGSIEKKLNALFVPKKDFDKLEGITGLKCEYPYKSEQHSDISPNDVEKMIETFSEAECLEDDAGWTAFCMTVALKQSDIPEGNRIAIVSQFLQNNGINGVDLYKINNKIEESSNFLKKSTWSQLLSNIGVNEKDFKYPFKTYEELVFNQARGSEVLKQLEEKGMKNLAPNEKEFVTELYSKIARSSSDDKSMFKETVQNWAKNNDFSISKANEFIKKHERRSGDVDYFKKAFRIKDENQQTIQSFSKILLATGMNESQVKEAIFDWKKRVNLNVPPEKIEKYIDQVVFTHQENEKWGKVTYVNKEQFSSLNETLKVNAPYFYTVPSFNSANPSINKIWKALWNELEKERMKTEKQNEFMKKREIQATRREQNRKAEREERG